MYCFEQQFSWRRNVHKCTYACKYATKWTKFRTFWQKWHLNLGHFLQAIVHLCPCPFWSRKRRWQWPKPRTSWRATPTLQTTRTPRPCVRTPWLCYAAPTPLWPCAASTTWPSYKVPPPPGETQSASHRPQENILKYEVDDFAPSRQRHRYTITGLQWTPPAPRRLTGHKWVKEEAAAAAVVQPAAPFPLCYLSQCWFSFGRFLSFPLDWNWLHVFSRFDRV